MSEEEKEAIKETKQVIEKWNDTNWLISYDHKNLEILLNYIDKLQKEIESKNKQIKLMQEMNLPEEIEINYISKDIIRNKIKELEEEREKTSFTFPISKVIYFLIELLGE